MTINGIEKKRKLTLGCPQGGVLSVLLWSLVFDDLLNKFTKGRITCVGYADDGCLIIQGNDLENMYKSMNKGLQLASNWAKANGLELSPSKTVAMVFTNKHDYKQPTTNLQVDGNIITPSTETKYLGVTLDNKLNWATHINNKITQAKRLLFKLRGTIGKLWGPCPSMMIWAYKTMVRPIITYCSFVWAHKLTQEQKNQLASLQRLALSMTAHMRHGLSLIHI